MGDGTENLRERFVATLLPLLINTTILKTLARLQRALDPLDIEGLSLLWNSLQSNTDNSGSVFGPELVQPSVEEWSHFVEKYLSSHSTLNHMEPSNANIRYYMLAYLLSATFKDCSIMVSIGPRNDESEDPIRVIDLDVKDINKFDTWWTLDQEIATAYRGVVHMRQCVDSSQ